MSAFGSGSLPWRKPGEPGAHGPRLIARYTDPQVTEGLARIEAHLIALEAAGTELRARLDAVETLANQTRAESKAASESAVEAAVRATDAAAGTADMARRTREELIQSWQEALQEALYDVKREVQKLETGFQQLRDELENRLSPVAAPSPEMPERETVKVVCEDAETAGSGGMDADTMEETLARVAVAGWPATTSPDGSPWDAYVRNLLSGLENLQRFCAGDGSGLRAGLGHIVLERDGGTLSVHDAFLTGSNGDVRSTGCAVCGPLQAACAFQVFLTVRGSSGVSWVVCPPGPVSRTHYPRLLRLLLEPGGEHGGRARQSGRAARLRRLDPGERAGYETHEVVIRMQAAIPAG